MRSTVFPIVDRRAEDAAALHSTQILCQEPKAFLDLELSLLWTLPSHPSAILVSTAVLLCEAHKGTIENFLLTANEF